MKPQSIGLAIALLCMTLLGACSRGVESASQTIAAHTKEMKPGNAGRASFGPRFTDDRHLIQALSDLQSPGLGYFMANQVGGHLDPSLDLVYVEMPEGHLNRYFTLEYKTDGTIQVVDDFIAPDEPEITRVHRSPSGALQYAQSNGTVVLPQRDP